MSYQSLFAKTAVTIAAAAFATAAFAHPKLLGSTPEDNSTVSAPKRSSCTSRKISPSSSPAPASDDQHARDEPCFANEDGGQVSGSDDPKTMVITPSQPLMPGVYSIEWRAVSSDTHPITGKITFTVK
jgi:methionine-rich copper-binding protein CopC